MKSTAHLATLTLILFGKLISGQQNSLVNNQHYEANHILTQHQPTLGQADNIQKILNLNEIANASPNNVNQFQAQIQTNAPAPLQSTQSIRLPPDPQQQILQVHHNLQLQQSEPQIKTQKPLGEYQLIQSQQATQPTLQLQQPVSQQDFQPQQGLQAKYLIQSQQKLQPQQFLPSLETIQPKRHAQLQQFLQPQHSQQHLQTQPPSLTQHSLQSQQLLQTQQPLQTQQILQGPQSLKLQQPFVIQQNSPPLNSIPGLHQKNDCQTNQHIYLTSAQPQNNNNMINVNIPLDSQSYVFEPQRKNVIQSAEVIANTKQTTNTLQEIPSVRYHIGSQPFPTSPSNAPAADTAIAIVPNYNIKPVEQSFVTEFYNDVKFIPEALSPLAEKTSVLSSIPTSHTDIQAVIQIPGTPVQNINPHTYYYNTLPSDQRQSVYVNQNPMSHYTQQSQLPVATVQSHAAALLPSQSQIIPPYTASLVQAPSSPVFSQYTIPPTYPVNKVMAPAYTTHTTKSSNLKSLLPLILNLLKEKIASNLYDDCPCKCKNKKNFDNDPDVYCGYSSQKNYGAHNEEALSVLDTVSEETEGTESLRERKDCVTNENVTLEVSSETVEEEDSEEDDGGEED